MDTTQQDQREEQMLSDKQDSSLNNIQLEPAAELFKSLGMPVNVEKILTTYLNGVLSNGMGEDRDVILKKNKNNITEDWKLLRAPELKDEVTASIHEDLKKYDRKLESGQNQLGIGISAVICGLSVLLSNDGHNQGNVRAIQSLKDACTILCDLHYNETQKRHQHIMQTIPIFQDAENNDSVSGNKTSRNDNISGTSFQSEPASKQAASLTSNKQNIQGNNVAGPLKSKEPNRKHQQGEGLMQYKQVPTVRYPGCSTVLKHVFKKNGTPENVMNMMTASYAKGTINGYDRSFKLWWKFCSDNNIRPYHPSVEDILKFLMDRFDSDDSDAVLKKHRSALSFLLGQKKMNDTQIKMVMKGVLKLKKVTSCNINDDADTVIL